MPARDDLQYITVDSFSPGMYDDWFADGGAMKAGPGAARVTGTFGCCASRSGSLVPAPKRVNRVQSSPTVSLTDSYDDTERIMAFRCMSPIWDRADVDVLESGVVNPFPDMLAFAFEAFTSGFNHHWTGRVYKMFQEAAANPVIDTVPEYTIATHSAGPYTERIKYGWSGIDLSRDNYSGPTIVGYPVIGFIFTSNKEVTEEEHLAYPDSAAPAVDGSTEMVGLAQSGGFAGYAMVAHQDRFILFDRSVNIALGADGEVPTDLIIGTAPNDVKTTGVTLTTFVAENPGLYGAWATVNASELLLVKQQRGGMAIRGDVDNPSQVVRLPGLPPTYEAINIAVTAQNGKTYYGSKNGVYAWSGGDTAELVSRALNGWFWKPGDLANDVLHCKGSFSTIERFLFAPNNFFYDIEAGGWWRLTDAEDEDYLPYAWWDVSASGNIIGAPNYLSDTQTVLADYYDIYQGQSEYNFVSQPLQAAKNRVLNFRQLNIKAQGVGEITFTIHGRQDDHHYRPVTIRVDSDEPVLYNLNVTADAYDPYYEIHARADNPANPAPEILSFELGYQSGATAQREQ